LTPVELRLSKQLSRFDTIEGENWTSSDSLDKSESKDYDYLHQIFDADKINESYFTE
jgi:hypothetical protein